MKEQSIKKRIDTQLSSSSSPNLDSGNLSSDSHYSENNTYNRKVFDNSREKLKKDMDNICKMYRFNHDILRLLVEIDFKLKIHYKIKVNGIQYNY